MAVDHKVTVSGLTHAQMVALAQVMRDSFLTEGTDIWGDLGMPGRRGV